MSRNLELPIGSIDLQKATLIKGAFEKINVKSIAGDNGLIEILDEDANIIYRSGKIIDEVSYYTKSELACIPIEDNPKFKVWVYPIKGENQETLIIRTAISDGETSYELLDRDLNIIHTSTALTKKKTYSERELLFLSGKRNDSYNLRRYLFTTEKGQNYILLVSTKQMNNVDTLKSMWRDFKFFASIFLLTYIFSIMLFIWWLNRKVKKPLITLSDAMLSYGEGNRKGFIDYTGPREFMEICNSFNKMATKLDASEKEKLRLENEKQKMIADISHDLKTPITVIKGYAEAVIKGIVAEEEKAEYLAIIYQKAEGLTELINTFYAYSRLEHPSYHLVLESSDICEYVREYLAEKYKDLYMEGFIIEVDIPESRIMCSFDKVELKRVFENIIINAIKHNEKKTTIFFALRHKEDNVEITIADDGCGIPQNIAATIFSPFVMGDDSRTGKQGSGLGLSISKKIVEAHGGSIRVVIPPEIGYKTQFEISLPL